MRLFVAIDLDDAVRVAIRNEQSRIARSIEPAGASLRWVSPDHMHITLVFIGERDEASASSITSAMAAELACPPFTVVLRHVGVFPPRGAPRALWIGVAGGARELSELQRRIADRLRPLGCADEGRPFTAHLTVGRFRTSRPADRRRVTDLDASAPIGSFVVDHATLYRSVLSSAGPSYTALARANLRL